MKPKCAICCTEGWAGSTEVDLYLLGLLGVCKRCRWNSPERAKAAIEEKLRLDIIARRAGGFELRIDKYGKNKGIARWVMPRKR